MDMFSDLPEPASSKEQKNTASALHNAFKSSSNKPDDIDLFGDLPTEATSSNGSKKENVQQGEKRKLEQYQANESCVKKRLSSDMYELKAFSASRKGERDEMQDAHTLIDDMSPEVESIGAESDIHRLGYYAVFDGHAGLRASQHASQKLHKHFSQSFPKGNYAQVEKEIKRCFTESFKKTDEEFLKEALKEKPVWKDGTTAVCVVALNNTLYIANLGDSKAIVCRYSESHKKCVALPLTKDHSASSYEERMRIQKAGGEVRDGRVMGVLEVSRSIGDGPYKRHGVSCVPDVKRCQLTENDRFILIACDGLWKTFDNEKAIEFVNKILEDETIEGTAVKSRQDIQMELACKGLANEAVRRLSADNVTVVLISIKKPTSCTKI